MIVFNMLTTEPMPTEMSIPAMSERPSGEGFQLSMEQQNAYPEIYAMFGDSDFHKATEFVNSRLKDPPDIPVRFTTCALPNALYRPGPNELVMCYELLDMVYKEAQKDKSIDDPVQFTRNAALFIFLHEMGHALVRNYDIPITGLEEDAVDQLAVVILARNNQFDALVASAIFFSNKQSEKGFFIFPNKALFSDVHSLDGQRYYNIICWAYGYDSEKYANAVTKGGLPEGRAQGCASEYDQLEKSWLTIMEPHLAPLEE